MVLKLDNGQQEKHKLSLKLIRKLEEDISNGFRNEKSFIPEVYAGAKKKKKKYSKSRKQQAAIAISKNKEVKDNGR